MKFMALEHEISGVTAADFAPHLEAEARQVWALQQAGQLREIYFRADVSTAVLVLECAGPEEARTVLESLPLTRAGLIHFELIPLRPYPGLARLFRPEPAG